MLAKLHSERSLQTRRNKIMQILHKYEYGKTLDYVDAKLEVKHDNSGNVQFTRTEAGLKADVPKSIQSIAVEGDQIVITNTANEETRVYLPPYPVDVKLQGAQLMPDNKLKLTLSDGSEIETDLAKLVDAPKSAQEYWDEIKALPTFKADLLAVLQGEVVQDFAGTTKGFLLPSA